MYSPVASQDHRRDTTTVPERLEPRLEQRRDHQGTAGEDMETTDGQGLVTGRNPAPPREISNTLMRALISLGPGTAGVAAMPKPNRAIRHLGEQYWMDVIGFKTLKELTDWLNAPLD